jgi:hypothetical protein
MKLSCPVIREGGSFVELWGTEYHFVPMLDGCHVAEVENPEHQDRFLEIGYKIYRGEDAQVQPTPKKRTPKQG